MTTRITSYGVETASVLLEVLVQSSEARTPSTAKNTRTFHLTAFIGASVIGLRPETSVPNHMPRVQCSRSGHLHLERTNLHTIQPNPILGSPYNAVSTRRVRIF